MKGCLEKEILEKKCWCGEGDFFPPPPFREKEEEEERCHQICQQVSGGLKGAQPGMTG